MKTKFILYFLGLFICIFSQAQNFDALQKHSETKILYDRVFPVSKAKELKTNDVTANYFLQVYHEIQRADFLNRFPKLESVKKIVDEGFIKNYIPLSLLITDFENIKPSELESKNVFINNQKNYDVVSSAKNVFNVNQVNLLGAILGKTKERSVTFNLKSNLIFNSSKRVVDFIEIKDDDTWKKINVDEDFGITFKNNGINTIFYKIHFTNGNNVSQSFNIDVQYQKRASEDKNFSIQPNVVTSITSTIPYKGYGETTAFNGIGEYEIYLDTVNDVLDKPIFLVDGFDPGDSRNTSQIYQLLNYGSNQNLGDLIRAQGYDIIVLNFPNYTRPNTSTIIDGGVDYIQRNAMILVELMKQINAQKVGSAKNVVIGPSMGGLISRYALKYMEQNSLNHDSRLYLSFDSPHLGANVPLGFQHLFNYMAYGALEDVTMQGIVNGMLKSPAAREMLLDHFEGHLLAGDNTEFDPAKLLPVGAPNYRAPFQNELNLMGFPQNTRNVAISNGAGNGTMTGTPGMTVMDHTFNTSSTQRAIINLKFTPAKNQTTEISRFKGQQWIFFWFTFYESFANSKSPANTDGLDSAPGGRFNLNNFAAAAAGSPLLEEFVANLNINYFNFIPAISSLAVSNTNNYYSNINSSSVTPFAAYSVPTVNEDHVTLNNQNVQFAINEILNDNTLATENTDLNKQIWIENPVRNVLKIKTNLQLKNAEIIITDLSGRKVLSKSQDISGLVEIPVQLTNGNYIITISTEKEKVTKKILVAK